MTIMSKKKTPDMEEEMIVDSMEETVVGENANAFADDMDLLAPVKKDKNTEYMPICMK